MNSSRHSTVWSFRMSSRAGLVTRRLSSSRLHSRKTGMNSPPRDTHDILQGLEGGIIVGRRIAVREDDVRVALLRDRRQGRASIRASHPKTERSGGAPRRLPHPNPCPHSAAALG